MWKEEKKNLFPNSHLRSHRAPAASICRKRDCRWALQRADCLPSLTAPGHHGLQMQIQAESLQVGGNGVRILIIMQIAAVNREPTDVYQERSILEALDPQPSDLASLGLTVPGNPQRKYVPYAISTRGLRIHIGDWQNENNILKRTFTDLPGVLLCAST